MDLDTKAKMVATTKATRARRATQEIVVRELKIARLSAVQQETVNRSFLEAKWLYNELLSDLAGWTSRKVVTRRLHDGTLQDEEFRALGAHQKQNLKKQIHSSIKTLATLKAQGKRVGRLKYKSEINAIEYSTGDLKVVSRQRVHLPKIGKVRTHGNHQLKNYEITNARLIRKASGLYLKITCAREPEHRETDNQTIGIDMGVKTHITVSDGREFHSMIREPERLKRLQRKLSRQAKGSNNYAKTRKLLRREYEKMDCRKDDLANKIVHELLGSSSVVMQDENLRGWMPRYSKGLQHSTLGRVKAKLVNHSRVTVVDRFAPTTQYCPACKSLNKLPLSERQYSCSCGYSAPRDLHAARNMAILAGEGWTKKRKIRKIKTPQGLGEAPMEGNAAGSRTLASKQTSLKQETKRVTLPLTRRGLSPA